MPQFVTQSLFALSMIGTLYFYRTGTNKAFRRAVHIAANILVWMYFMAYFYLMMLGRLAFAASIVVAGLFVLYLAALYYGAPAASKAKSRF